MSNKTLIGPALIGIGVVLAACPPGAGPGQFPWPIKELTSPPRPHDVSSEVRTLTPGYDRRGSLAMIRAVKRPTRANLDYAAYDANVILHGPAPEGVQVKPGQAAVPADREQLFGKALQVETIVASLAGTPLTDKERGQPLAFSPMVDYLAQWSSDKTSGLEEARSAVKAETWGLRKRPGTFFQQIATLFLHRPAKGGTQLWAEVEFEPWARLFSGMPDEDSDGYPEIYAQLRPDLFSPEVVERLQQDYIGRTLSTKEVHAWANELASYWYPSHNTDIFPLGSATAWPVETTEPAVKATLKGFSVERPTIAIRGKPHGKAIYNIFVLAGIEPLANKPTSDAKGQAKARLSEQLKKAPVSASTKELEQALTEELKQHGGGSWKRWAGQLAPLHRKIRGQLKRRSKELHSVLGKDSFVFYRRSLGYVVGGDVQAQPPNKNPFATIVAFKDYLARLGVDFLLVPVPTKSEVFPDRLVGAKLPPKGLQPIHPYGRKFLLELSRAGVEVVDLLPAYLAARAKRKEGEELLYQPQDTHWTDRGLRLAAEQIAARIKRYPWYPLLEKEAVNFSLKQVTFKRFGDLHSRLTEKEQKRYKPATLVGHRVLTPKGDPYEDDPASPIVMLGDSFTGVFQRTYCRNAGISAHVAHQIRYPVDLVMSYGGGPNVRQKLLTRGEADLKKKRLLIWLFAARDFFNYWDDWTPLKTDKDKTGK